MAKNLKTYAVLTIMVLGLVFMGIGCTGTQNSEDSSPVQETSSEGAPAAEAPAAESQSIFLKGSDTVLPLAQAEAEEFMIAYPEKSALVIG